MHILFNLSSRPATQPSPPFYAEAEQQQQDYGDAGKADNNGKSFELSKNVDL